MQKISVLLKIFLLFLLFNSTVLSGQDRIIAIGPFENQGQPADDWLETGIKQVLYDKFNFNEKIQITNPNMLNRLLIKFTNGNVYQISPRAAYKVNKEVGTEIMLIGKYRFSGGNVTINFSILNMYSGSSIYSAKISGSVNNILDYLNQIAVEFASKTEIPTTPRDKAKLEEKITNNSMAFQNYCRAYVEFNKPNPDSRKVRQLFKKAIDLDPNFWEAQYNLATALYNDHKYKQSIDQFSMVIKRQPKFFKAYFGRGLIYLKFKQYNNALKEFEKVKREDPENKDVDYYMGMLYNRTQKTLDAVNSLQIAIRKNPEHKQSFYELGKAYASRNDINKATRYYKDAIRIDPKYSSAHHELGVTYMAVKQYDNAIYHFLEAIKYFPNFANAYFDLGNSYYKQGVLQEYIDNYLDIINTAENSTVKVAKAEQVSPNMSRTFDKIIDALKKSVSIDPEFYEAHFNLALTYHKYGKYSDALRHYQKTIELNPTLIKAYMQLGYLYDEQKQYKSALAEFKKVVRIRPDYFDPKSNLGENYQYRNPLTEVQREAQSNIENNPNDLDARLVLAKIYDTLGQRSKALNEYELVLKMNPADRSSRKRVRELKEKLQ